MRASVAAFRRMLHAYSKSLERRPYTTQVLSSAVIWGAGDVLAQCIENRPRVSKLNNDALSTDIDKRRFVMTTTYGGLFSGILGHTWYIGLDKVARAISIPGSPKFVAAKVCADTLIFGPIHVAAFFAFLTICEGGTLEKAKDKIKTDFMSTFITELGVWPVAQALNFKFIPLKFQLLTVNTLTVVDAAFMSWVQHNDGWLDRFLSYMSKNK